MTATDVSLADRRTSGLTILAICVALATMALGGVALLESRTDAWNQARKNASNLLMALDRDIGRNLTVLDLSLQGLAEALAEPGIMDVSPGIRHHALFDRSASAEDLGAVLALDANGDIIESSTSLVPHQLNLGDRDYFQVHRYPLDGDFYVSRVFKSRLANDDLRFAISRRLTTPDGKFGGVVAASLRLNHFRSLFTNLDLGENGTITLLRTDGYVLFRQPFRTQDIDADLSKLAMFKRLTEAKSGQFVAYGKSDKQQRLYTYRRVGDLPLILSVSQPTAEIFQPWRRKATLISLAMMWLCVSAIACALLFRREMLRRAKSERDLASVAAQLAILAATDGLTGLMNRRAFDSEFALAFRAAIRAGTSISVLMIDVDFFKTYNDMAGHVAGDVVLRELSRCMQGFLRRPSDKLARYGGEEFVAILPDTDAVPAGQLAERIRAGVRALQIPHLNSPVGFISVSIGTATANPLLGDWPEILIQRADYALYSAKTAGRNCVRSAADVSEAAVDLSGLVRSATALRIAGPVARTTY